LFEALEAALLVAVPVVLGMLVRNLQTGGSYATGWMLGAVFVVLNLLFVFAHHLAFLGGWRIGALMRSACIALVYRKLGRVRTQALAHVTTGHVVNLISNDVDRLAECGIPLPFLVISPCMLAAITVLVYQQVGAAAFVGLAYYVGMMPYYLWTGAKFKQLRQRMAAATDRRVKLMAEMIAGARVVKLFAWEINFAAVIGAARTTELALVRAVNYLNSVTYALVFTGYGQWLAGIVKN
jgi:ATP-binding cassette subfamily C (CFTR/MRP) protein 4